MDSGEAQLLWRYLVTKSWEILSQILHDREAKEGSTQEGTSRNCTRKTTHTNMGTPCRWGTLRALALLHPDTEGRLHHHSPLFSIWVVLWNLGSSVSFLMLNYFYYYYYSISQRCLFGRWKSWHTSLYLAKAKGFPLRCIPYSPLKKVLLVHHVAVLIMCFSCIVISQIKLDLVLNSQLGHPTNDCLFGVGKLWACLKHWGLVVLSQTL